jgi:tRNA dimethylallyltransferase
MSTSAAAAPVIFLMGPTASGKTDAACRLADEFDCEIVSVDSAMVYRGLDIGTAKPSPGLLARYPHHLIDLCDPGDAYSAARFRRDALVAVDAIRRRGRRALLVGGTGLYFRVLEDGIAELPHGDRALRRRLESELEAIGLGALHARLAAVDPDSAARIHRNDPQRTLRALEVYELSGSPMSVLLREAAPARPPFAVIKLVLLPADRGWLHRRIERRFQAMLNAGFINEVGVLRDRADLGLDKAALRAVGYRAIWRYLEGEYGFAEMVARGISATRQLAKRQLTWFRAVRDSHRFDPQLGDVEHQLSVALKRHSR